MADYLEFAFCRISLAGDCTIFQGVKSMHSIHVRCSLCIKVYSLKVYGNDWVKFLEGKAHVQNIFPYLSDGERELLISGLCETCFDGLDWGEGEL